MSVLTIAKPPYFSFRECLWFLDRNHDDCLLQLSDQHIRKALYADGEIRMIDVSEKGNDIIISSAGELSIAATKEIREYVMDWFDLRRDLEPFVRQLESHHLFRYMAADFYGLRLMGIPDLFEALCWSITGQQINLTFAYKLKRALVEKYGAFKEIDNIRYYVFPKPEALAALNTEDLKSLQFSKQKAGYIIAAARSFVSGAISKSQLSGLSSEDKIISLSSLKGIGAWTANYILMKSLNDTSGIPHGDVGLLRALEKHGVIESRKDGESISALFKQFPGWESYLVHYLWRSLAV